MSSWQLAPSCTHQGLPANAAEPSSPFIGTDRSFCQLWLSRDTVREMSKTTRRGAPRRGEPSARDRLIETAIELFYQKGIRAIGIDTVIARSGVSKSSLYRTFASKDDLIAAFAEEQNRRFWQWWDEIVERHPGAPSQQISSLLEGIGDQIASPQFRGCPFINLAPEFPDRRHPGPAIA